MKRTALLRRTRLRPVSKRRARELRTYSVKRKVFLAEHPLCQVWLTKHGFKELGQGFYEKHGGKIYSDLMVEAEGCPKSCDVHHKAGRTGGNYLAESTWMAVSRDAHDWIHANPSEARRRGWLV